MKGKTFTVWILAGALLTLVSGVIIRITSSTISHEDQKEDYNQITWVG